MGMKMKKCVWWVGIALLSVAVQAGADVNISTLPLSSSIQPFGESNTATYGQTITAPGSSLGSFSFWLDDYVNPDYVDFAGYVMAWDGSKATGPVLWSSNPVSTTNNGGQGGWEKFTFNTGGVALNSGSRYVLFMSASNYFDGAYGTSMLASGATPYDGGSFVFMNNGSDFSALTNTVWDNWDSYDAAFEADFGGSVVPLPGAVLLGVLGLGTAGLRLRRK